MSRKRRRSSRAPLLVGLLLIAAAVAVAARSLPRHGWPQWRLPPLGPQHVASKSQPMSRTLQQPASQPAASVPVEVYFLHIVNGKERMEPVAREVTGAAPARAALEALLSGPVPAGCARPLPPGVTLRGVRVEGGTVTADFSKELVSDFRGGSDSEGVAVYAIVNTLSSLPGVKRTQLLVEGERVDTLGGHLDISGPLTADDELVIGRE